jgi:hypothetical protein
LFLESIPYLVSLLHEAINTSDRRSNGLEARELCKGLSKLSVANDNKHKVKEKRRISFFFANKRKLFC